MIVGRKLLCAALAALAVVAPAGAEDTPTRYAGRALADVLGSLQQRGLRIVFTTGIVTPNLRVRSEPRAGTPRQQLDEILAPHGLVARDGPGGTIQIVRARPAAAPPVQHRAQETAEPSPAEPPPAEPPRIYNERVTVRLRPWWSADPGTAAETRLDREQLNAMPAGLIDDPGQVIRSLPRVMPIDDYHSEFVVRASPFRHAEMVIDGVATPWLRHTAQGRGDAASVSMLTNQVIDTATLRAGAYPRRYGDRLGPQLDLTIREGARDRLRARAAVTGTQATMLGEGPIGSSGRGSWLLAVRQSFLEWPRERLASGAAPFGFNDVTAKVVYDATPRQQLAVTLLRGTARVDGEDHRDAGLIGDGVNEAAIANIGWRSIVGTSTVLTQRVFVVGQTFFNKYSTGERHSDGADHAIAYRSTVIERIPAGLVEGGAEVGQTRWQRSGDTGATSWSRSAYVHVAWTPWPALTFAPGVRVSAASHLPARALSRWLLGQWALSPRWTVTASTGSTQQLPELGLPQTRPERATYVDVGIGQHVGDVMRWEATIYHRSEAEVLDTLSGSPRGIELLIERQRGRRFSGWASYSYGRARQRYPERHETFWARFDQRHTVTAFGAYRFAGTADLGATIRIGSGMPAADRTLTRLPTYARLDARAGRSFEVAGRRVTAFGEIVNLLNRANGPSDRLSPRRATAGVAVVF